MPDYQIVIDYEDWYIFFTDEGVEIKDKDDIAELSETYTAGEIAKMLLAGREEGQVEAELLPGTNKWLLLSGARAGVSSMLASRRVRKKLETGKEITIRERVGVPSRSSDGPGHCFYRYDDDKALELVDNYLFTNVVGHARTRLEIVAAKAGREAVRERIEQLKGELDRLEWKIFDDE